MKQLFFDLRPDRPPAFDNFAPGGNAELLAHLALLVDDPAQLPGAHLYLWGSPGCGRSHLLQASVARARSQGRPAFFLKAGEIADALPDAENALLALDDVERLAPETQIALFNAFNRSRDKKRSLLLSGPVAPRGLRLREDLRTRIGQSLIFEVRPLDDETRAAILRSLAERRGLRLSDEVAAFVLNHGRRDPPGMAALIDALDAASLEHKRPLTLPLLRELMRQGLHL